MVERINISVPDDLHSELDKWREQVNVSRICQEALRKELHHLQLQEAPVELGAERIEMLRAEKAESEAFWRGLGAEHGREWATTQAHYVDLKYFGTFREGRPPSERHGPVEFELPEEVTGHPGLHYRHRLQDDPTVDLWAERVGLDEEAYKKGWLDGVEAVWKQVKDLL